MFLNWAFGLLFQWYQFVQKLIPDVPPPMASDVSAGITAVRSSFGTILHGAATLNTFLPVTEAIQIVGLAFTFWMITTGYRAFQSGVQWVKTLIGGWL